MRIGIIHQTSSVGGFRYLYNLVLGIKKYDKNIDITIFTVLKDGSLTFEFNNLKENGIKIKILSEEYFYSKIFKEKNKFKNKILNNIFNNIRKKIFLKKRKSYQNFINQNEFDLFFYSWPYEIYCIESNKPIFFIPHDFIYTHSFGYDGVNLYNQKNFLKHITYHKDFISKNAIPIVSSHYIKDEFNKNFPNYKNEPNVVYLSTLNDYDKATKKEVDDFLRKINIKNDYILFASNNMPHKNLTNLLGAWYYIKQKFPNLKLIISGYGNNNIKLNVNSPYYADHTEEENCDVKSTGLLNDKEFSFLLQGAKIVINPSLCEAGNGSGLDAWKLGVPVAMSDIPAFKNQIDNIGVKAELFDPKNSKDIARAVIYLLENPDIANENVKISQEKINNYSWERVAEQYINIFKKHL